MTEYNSGELPAAKGDRLDRTAPPAIAVQDMKVVAPEGKKEPEPVKREITSWHWHEGTKAVRRK